MKRGIGIGIFVLLAAGWAPAGAENVLYAPGRWAYERGDYQKARDIFTGELQKSPKDADAAYGLGNSLYQLGRYDQAAQAYQKCLQNDPKMEAGWYNLGNSLYQQKHYQEAAQSYQKALDLDPKDQAAARNLKLAQSKIPPSPTPTPGSKGPSKKKGPGGGQDRQGKGGKPNGPDSRSGQGRTKAPGGAPDQSPGSKSSASTGPRGKTGPSAAPTPSAEDRREAQARRELGLSDAQVRKLLEQAGQQERQNQDYFSLNPKRDQQEQDPFWGMMPKEQRDLMKRLFGFQKDKNQPEEDW